MPIWGDVCNSQIRQAAPIFWNFFPEIRVLASWMRGVCLSCLASRRRWSACSQGRISTAPNFWKKIAKKSRSQGSAPGLGVIVPGLRAIVLGDARFERQKDESVP
jgi:hypothetical protein